MALEAYDAKTKTTANKGRLDMFPKTPVSKFVKAAKVGTTLGGVMKTLTSAPAQSQQRSGSLAAAFKKTTNVAMEISVPTKLSSVVEVMKKTEGTEANDVMR